MIKISIIVPVYNAQIHLEKCITSLLAQTIDEVEFIFINDGSTDDSQKTIALFQQKDTRIICLNQENQGVSVARNNGISIAKGEYIGFVDADDYVENNYFETLYTNAKKYDSDVTISNYHSSQEGNQFISKSLFKENIVYKHNFIQENIIPVFIKTDKLNAIWNKLYKKQIIDNHNITFPKGIPLGEDGWFNLNFFNVAKKAIFIDYAGYHYIDVTGSATRNFQSTSYFKRIEQNYLQDYSMFKNEYLSNEKIQFLKAKKFINKTIALLHEYYKNALPKSQKNSLIKEIYNSKQTQKIINKHYKQLVSQSTKYEQGFLLAFKYKLPIIARLLIAYSNFRNKK